MAGPNGSGKSSITRHYPVAGHYVNADEIQKHLSCSEKEAALIAEATREELLRQKETFTFETVLSTDRNYSLMERAKAAGYHVVCIFVLTKDPKINVARVKSRMEQGGNAVKIEKIKPRYCRSLALFPKLFAICDELYVYDNSLEHAGGGPTANILTCVNGEIEYRPNEVWSNEMLNLLVQGKYAEQFLS